jgi:hypothetical protein
MPRNSNGSILSACLAVLPGILRCWSARFGFDQTGLENRHEDSEGGSPRSKNRLIAELFSRPVMRFKPTIVMTVTEMDDRNI